MIARTTAIFTTAGFGLVIACGDGASVEFDTTSTDNPGTGGPKKGVQTFAGQTDAGPTEGTNPTCATSQQGAQLAPANLVFMYDKSGSMGDGLRAYNCPAGFGVVCHDYDVIVGGAPVKKYICARNTAEQLAADAAGNIYQGGQACPASVLGGKPAILCTDVNTCTSVVYDDPAAKWIPVGDALKAFFADKKSAGLSATLNFFPQIAGDAVLCAATDYQTPKVALTALPEGSVFANAIAAQAPMGSTPTKMALQGAIDHAKALAASGKQTVVVLVTDGDPTVCNTGAPDNVADVATVAAGGVTANIKTYVIGVGASLANLNAIANAGGTTAATLVSTANTAQTSADFQKALEAIRGKAVSCDVPLPPPPAGQTLDINTVNVVATLGGKAETLAYSKDCATGSGWHYDNAAAPTKVQLCSASCDAVRADSGGQLGITFGCATKGGVIR